MIEPTQSASHQPALSVHLAPSLVDAVDLSGCVAIAIDVLRATTTLAYALEAGCTRVYPCAEIDEAKQLARELADQRPLLGGEREGQRIDGFDLGNAPQSYTSEICKGRPLVMTTTNGTRTLLRCATAERVVTAAFVNLEAVCEQLRSDVRPIHIVCSGKEGTIALEDVLLAGALVIDLVSGRKLNDGARIARECYLRERDSLEAALKSASGGVPLVRLGYHEDIRIAAQTSVVSVVPELRKGPWHLVDSTE